MFLETTENFVDAAVVLLRHPASHLLDKNTVCDFDEKAVSPELEATYYLSLPLGVCEDDPALAHKMCR